MIIIGSVPGQRTILHAQLYGDMIQGYIEKSPWDKRFKLTANVLFMFILQMIMLNCIFVFGLGLYGQQRNLTAPPILSTKLSYLRRN